MNLLDRAKAPTPKFFRILRTVGLTLLAISGSVLAAPVALPAAVVSVAGYLAVAGGVISAVSQITTQQEAENDGTNSQFNNGYFERNFAQYFTSAEFPRYFGNGGSGYGWSYYQFFGEFIAKVGAGGFQKIVESLNVESLKVKSSRNIWELFLLEVG